MHQGEWWALCVRELLLSYSRLAMDDTHFCLWILLPLPTFAWGQRKGIFGANFGSSVPSSLSYWEEGTFILEIVCVHLEVHTRPPPPPCPPASRSVELPLGESVSLKKCHLSSSYLRKSCLVITSLDAHDLRACGLYWAFWLIRSSRAASGVLPCSCWLLDSPSPATNILRARSLGKLEIQ